MKKLSKLTWMGIACILSGLSVVGAWSIWMRTRSIRPVDMPIAQAASHFGTPEFQTNLDYPYAIEVEATESFQQQKPLPFAKFNCLMGIHHFLNEPIFDVFVPAEKDCENAPAIRADWIVTSGPDIVAEGFSPDSDLGLFSEDKIKRVIGSFDSQKGGRYVLGVDFKTDMYSLSSTNPHLVIEASPDFYEENFLMGKLLLTICLILVSIGAILLVIAAVRQGRKRLR